MSRQNEYTALKKQFEAQHDKLIEDDYEVGKKKIDWESIPSNYITKRDILIFKSLEGSNDELLAPNDDINALFNDDDNYKIAKAFVGVLDITKNETLTYILTLLSHILTDDPIRGKIFLKLTNNNDNNDDNNEIKYDNDININGGKTILDKFKSVWLRDELTNFVRGKAAICCANILRWGNKYYISDYRSLANYLFNEFFNKQNDGDALLPSLYALKGIVINEYFQQLFISEAGIDKLAKILDNNKQHHQVVYLVSYCLWVISYKKDYKVKITDELLIKKLCKLVRIKLSIKVMRVILAMFENLLYTNDFNEMVVQNDLYDTLQELNDDEKVSDDELKKSITNLLDKLEKSVRILSSFETYQQEIKFKTLKWGPCHTPQFFKKYSRKFEDENFKLIKSIINLLDNDDSEVITIACYDIGQWSKYYADAKFILESLKGKYKLMSLIDHNDDNVRKEALIAVQSVLIGSRNTNMDANESKTAIN